MRSNNRIWVCDVERSPVELSDKSLAYCRILTSDNDGTVVTSSECKKLGDYTGPWMAILFDKATFQHCIMV